MTYDQDNIFAKILKGDIPCDKVFESEKTLAFNDISPAAPRHILVIPKGPYTDIVDFASNASQDEQADFWAAVTKIAKDEGLNEKGFRSIANTGDHGGQEVPHFHLHLLGGEPIGKMRSKD